MRRIFPALIAILFFSACHHANKTVVDPVFADSLITHYSPSPVTRSIDSNLVFWERRMKERPDNFVNGPEYASALLSSFRLHGDLEKLVKADSLMHRSNESNQYKEAGIFRNLASLALLQHRFQLADSFLKQAILIDGKSYANVFLEFDIAFELGQIIRAKELLNALKGGNPYGYLFRRSRMEHFDGSLDTAIACMTRAAERSGGNKYLKQAALSNAGDLYVHKGDLTAAYNCYKQSIETDAADFHSIMGLGWIALVHDKNDSLARTLFDLVLPYYHAPDALLKLEQSYEMRDDSVHQWKYAEEFVTKVSAPGYGQMYNKYLIDLYTGIFHDPAKAVSLAQQEIPNRPTSQVYAWYAWSLFCNGEKDKAYSIFKEYVSGRPLEGPELFYMGKMMKGLDKGYNAQQFFKAAYKNRYDLSPAKAKQLVQF